MRSDSLFFAHNTVVDKKETVPDKQLPIEYGFIKVMMKHFMYACVAIRGTGFLFRRISPWRSSLLLSLLSIPQIHDCLLLFQRMLLPPERRCERLLRFHILEDKNEVYIQRFYLESTITENILFASSIPNILPPVSIPTTTARHFVLFFLFPLG